MSNADGDDYSNKNFNNSNNNNNNNNYNNSNNNFNNNDDNGGSNITFGSMDINTFKDNNSTNVKDPFVYSDQKYQQQSQNAGSSSDDHKSEIRYAHEPSQGDSANGPSTSQGPITEYKKEDVDKRRGTSRVIHIKRKRWRLAKERWKN